MTTEGDNMSDIQAEFHCDECERTFETAHGVTMHKNRSHYTGPPRERAARAAKAHTPDELFELVGAATEALFPAGIPMSRLIEIAELQKAMIKVLVRA